MNESIHIFKLLFNELMCYLGRCLKFYDFFLQFLNVFPYLFRFPNLLSSFVPEPGKSKGIMEVPLLAEHTLAYCRYCGTFSQSPPPPAGAGSLQSLLAWIFSEIGFHFVARRVTFKCPHKFLFGLLTWVILQEPG